MWLINHLRLNRGEGLWPLGWGSQVLTPPGVVVWQRATMSAVNSWSYLRLQSSSSYRSIFKSGNFHCNYSIKNAFTRGKILTLALGSKGKVKSSNCFEFKIIHMSPKIFWVTSLALAQSISKDFLYVMTSRKPLSVNKKLNRKGERENVFAYLPKIAHCFS